MMTESPPRFDEFLLLVGKLNYTWTNTESMLIHLIAGLAKIEKNTALVIFLTLNTTRARIDLVERLSKMETTDAAERARILEVTSRLLKLSGLRNRLNHCIYAFDPDGGNPRTILMRIADRKDKLMMGAVYELDDKAFIDIKEALSNIQQINQTIWKLVADFKYPV